MESRIFKKEDYEMICEWWVRWGWPVIPMESLSETGVIVSNNNKDICAAWIYKTDSSLCWIDWFISSKDTEKEDRNGCVEYLIEDCMARAKSMGFVNAFCSIKNNSLINKIEKAGWIGKEPGMTNFIGVL